MNILLSIGAIIGIIIVVFWVLSCGFIMIIYGIYVYNAKREKDQELIQQLDDEVRGGGIC